jgi:hypothetical protein
MRGQRHVPAAFYPRKDPVPIVQEAGWAPGPVLTGAENLSPTGVRSPDRPARSQLLYRLSYPAHLIQSMSIVISSIHLSMPCQWFFLQIYSSKLCMYVFIIPRVYAMRPLQLIITIPAAQLFCTEPTRACRTSLMSAPVLFEFFPLVTSRAYCVLCYSLTQYFNC